jgi:hypothetical protein
MIFDFIVTALNQFLQTVLSVLPNAPAVPTALDSATTYIISTITGAVSLLQTIFGYTFFNTIIVIIVGIFLFEQIYHSVMWVIRKIPIVDIS